MGDLQVTMGFNMFQRSNLILDDWGTLHFNKLPPEARAGEVASPLVSVRQRQESRTTITFQKVGLSHWVTDDQYHCPICPMVYFKGNLIIVKHHDHCFSACLILAGGVILYLQDFYHKTSTNHEESLCFAPFPGSLAWTWPVHGTAQPGQWLARSPVPFGAQTKTAGEPCLGG